MFYLITGTPGSGKTLYAVSTLVQELMKQKLTGKDGKPIQRRLVVDGIPDLIIPHETMTPSDIDAKTSVISCEGQGLANWPEWVQPGDVMVVDEVQRYLRPRGLGTKPQLCVTELETHRHKGIDVVFITQNPMLVDQNVRRLVNQHLHLRRLFGGTRAVVYQWDSCSADVHRVSTCTTKSYWGYPKDAYKLYKSSELHTKVKAKIPAWVAVPVLAVVCGVLIAPKAFGVLSGAMTGKGISGTPVSAASAPKAPASAPVVVAAAPVPGPVLPPVAAVSSPVPEDTPKGGTEKPVGGCIATAKACKCFDGNGKPVEVEPDYCRSETGGDLPEKTGTMLALLREDRPYPAGVTADDVAYLHAVRSGSGSPGARVIIPVSPPKPDPLPVVSTLDDFRAAPIAMAPRPSKSATR